MKGPTTTTTPTNPEWVTSGIQNIFSGVQGLSGADPQSFVAGSNKYLDTAGAGLMGGMDPNIQKYLDAGASGGGGVGYHAASDFMDNYKNPYLKDVLDTSLADYDMDAGRRNAQSDLDLSGASAWGGSGSAITKSMLGGELARGRGALSAGIRSDAFNTAANLGGQDASQATQADSTNAQLGESRAARALQAAGLLGQINSQNTNSLLNIGQMQYGMDQAKAQAPLSLLQAQAGLAGSLPLNLFSGSTTKQSGGGLQSLLGGLGTAAFGAGSLGWKPFG